MKWMLEPSRSPAIASRKKPLLSTGDWTGILRIIQYQRISPPDPKVFTGLDLNAGRQRRH
jgi:hypothetical protein